MKRCVGLGLLTLLIVACTSPAPRPFNAPPTPTTIEALIAAITADAARSDHETDSKVREALAEDAVRDADACIAIAPRAAGCLYDRAVALGLEARAHPTRAGELLKTMIGALDQANEVDPGYDQAGPSRVRALVLVRAPGWPLGPGDADAGLAAARRAVALRPQYPPNLLALGEALAKTGDATGARETYQKARDFSQASPASPDRDEWLREADQALRRP